MSSVHRMQGTPWHTERVHRGEDDDRRYKGRCKYYSYSDNHCSRRSGKCIGSSHCSDYKAISEEAFKKRQKDRQPRKISKQEKDDCYRY